MTYTFHGPSNNIRSYLEVEVEVEVVVVVVCTSSISIKMVHLTKANNFSQDLLSIY